MTDEDKLKKIKDIVDQQAEDEGLWFFAEHVTEAYLQAALRRLHRAIEEGDSVATPNKEEPPWDLQTR